MCLNIKCAIGVYFFSLWCISIEASTFQSSQVVLSWSDNNREINIQMVDGILRLRPMADNAVRVRFLKENFFDLPEWIYLDNLNVSQKYNVIEDSKAIWLNLKNIIVRVDKQTGKINYCNADKITVLKEKERNLQTSSVQGKSTYCAEQSFESPKDEYLFGLGQFQDGFLNIRGLSRRLTQVNTQIAIPFILSNKGYGLLWNNYGLTEFNPSHQKVKLEKNSEVGLREVVNTTSTEGSKQEVRESNSFVATINISIKGKYALLLDVGQKMARSHHLKIDGQTVINMKNLWLPPTTSIILELDAGPHTLQADLEKNDQPILYYKLVDDQTVLRSPVSSGIDYTVFTGNADQVISTYRNLTGNVPMMPRWALGYIHCRERFKSQNELLETAQKFRDEQIPIDVIVQDWMYWGKYGWNAMRFDEEKYPNPTLMVKQLHDMNLRLMVSVWSKINPASSVGKLMEANHYFIPNTSWVDFFNPKAAAAYWDNFSKGLLKPFQIDAWWQDATEPENDDLVGRKVMEGKYPGEVFRNIYPLLVNKTVYEGCRRDDPMRRTMILTRSGFSGMQRYATATWSGDIGHDWETLRRQITGGLNMMASGMPWWTYDAGGFFRPGKKQYTDVAYHERFLRWFQIGTFLPLFRVHGYQTDTEFWNYGKEMTRIARISLDLRYRLLPYIYSETAKVSFKGGTMMRPLVMDFANDTMALSQKYEFMFGPSFLVIPITEEGIKYKKIYLPTIVR